MPLADGVSFLAASAGTGTFVFSTSRNSFLTLAQAEADGEITDGQVVSYLAFDSASSPTQREWGHGIYSSSGGSITRATILGGTAGPGTAVNFAVPPTVSLTLLAEDLPPVLLGFLSGLILSQVGNNLSRAQGLSIGFGMAADSTGAVYITGSINNKSVEPHGRPAAMQSAWARA